MCVSTQTGKSNSDAVRIAHACHDSALTLDHMFDRARGIIEDPSNGRLPSAKDQITYFHISIIPEGLDKVKNYFR